MAVGPVKVFFSYSVVAIAGPVLDDVTFALVKFPVADQAGSFGIDIVHIVPNFLFAAGYRPDTHFGNIAVELARVVIRLAEEELAGNYPSPCSPYTFPSLAGRDRRRRAPQG